MITMRKNKGFTLVELMITAMILAVAIAGLLSASVSSLLLNESNQHLVTAANDAQFIMEQIKGLEYSLIDSYSPPTFSNLESESATVNVSGSSTLKEVTVNVNWTERQRARTFELKTRIAR